MIEQVTIIWTGDLADDCSSSWEGLLLRAEWMEKDTWWWAVYDMERDEVQIDSSNNYSKRCRDGDAARTKAEEVARNYLPNRK